MEECRNFAKNLEAIRSLKNVTISEFSEELDLPKSTLQDVLRNGNASLHTALHIAGQLNVPLSALTGEAASSDNLDGLSALLNFFGWFSSLPDETRRQVGAHIRAILDALQ